jgi:hypothetical protein
MRTVEITRTGDASISDQIFEMQMWLREAGITPVALELIRILQARVHYRVAFANDDDAERFRRRFDAESAGGSS